MKVFNVCLYLLLYCYASNNYNGYNLIGFEEGNLISMHNYKYLEIPIFNRVKYCNSWRETDTCMKFAMIL